MSIRLMKIGKVAASAALLAVLFPSLCAAGAPPATQNPIVTVLPWVGASSNKTSASLMLQTKNVIVAIGDSITAGGGYLRDSDEALTKLYPNLQIPAIVNMGIGSQTSGLLVDRFQKDVVDRKPAIVIINIGINDIVYAMIKTPYDESALATYKNNIVKMVNMSQANGIQVILLTPTILKEDPTSEGNKRLVSFAEVMEAVALEKKCGVADLHAMFMEALKHKPADVKDNWLTKDGIHMTSLGDAVMAVGVLRALGVPDKKLATLK